MTTEQLSDLVDIGILVVDREGRVTLWNRWLEEHSGRRRGDVLKQTLWELYPEVRERKLDARIRHVLETGQPQVLSPSLHGYLLPLSGQDGEPMAQMVRILPLWEQSQVSGALITLRDVTAVVQAEAELLHATEQLRLLQETAGSLAAMHSLEDTLQAIADHALEALDAQAVVIFAYEEEMGLLRVSVGSARQGVKRLEEVVQRVAGQSIKEVVTSLSEPDRPLAQVVTTGQPLFGARGSELKATPLHRKILAALGKALGREAVTILPLKVGDRVLGAMIFDSPPREQITPRQQALYLAFASHAAVAIENARLHEEAQRLAITDGLTGVYNHRYFYHVLETEMARVERYGGRVSLIMLDIDNFKRYNDTYGHLAGDRLLQEIAHLLIEATREADIVARYGGEEFAVILPETDKAGTVATAERIRTAVEHHTWPDQANGEGVTISAGVATHPPDAATAEELIRAADTALYEAKQRGKNRVCAYGEPDCHDSGSTA